METQPLTRTHAQRIADLESIMGLCRTVLASRTASPERRVRAMQMLERCSRERDELAAKGTHTLAHIDGERVCTKRPGHL